MVTPAKKQTTPPQAELLEQADTTTTNATTYTPNENDIIDDILRRVIAMAPGFSAAIAAQIEAEARKQWGGDRPYVGKRSGMGTSARNAAIKRDYLAGEHFHLMERRYGLGRSRLNEIIKS